MSTTGNAKGIDNYIGNMDAKSAMKNHLLTRHRLESIKYVDFPFKHSYLVLALGLCLMSQTALQPAYAQTSNVLNNLTREQTKNLSEEDLQNLDEVLVEQNNELPENDAELSNQQLEEALIALKLKRAVEQGMISPEVLEDYQRETLDQVWNQNESEGSANNNSIQKSPVNQKNNSQKADVQKVDTSNYELTDELYSSDDTFAPNDKQEANTSDILDFDQWQEPPAAVDFASNQTILSPQQLEENLNQIILETDTDFNQPEAKLDASQPPLGFDNKVDEFTNFTPSNRETLGLDEETQESDSDNDFFLSEETNQPIDINNDEGLNPDDYLPEYDSNVNGGFDDSQLNTENNTDNDDEAKPGFFERVYNRIFNNGFAALPRIKANVYLQQINENSNNPKLVRMDSNSQPANNIKSALENITVEAIKDFTAATPKLYEVATNAAEAVGYYDVRLRFNRADTDQVDVIVENLGEPVKVSSRIIDIRGEGNDLPEFQEIESKAPPEVGDVFNHGIYDGTKNKIERVSSEYGFFDANWLNKSVDVILPDNTADVDLIYETGERYDFDNVVFFTIDEDTRQLTTDPSKLPLKLELLHQLHDFKAGDKFYSPLVTKFTNDLSATRYFNAINVETITPPKNNASTLSFDDDATEFDSDIDSSQSASNASSDSALDIVESNSGSSDNLINESLNNIPETNEAITTQASTEEDLTDSQALSENTNISESDSNNLQSNQDIQANAENSNTQDGDLEPVEYSLDQETTAKLEEIIRKAVRLSRLPDDRVLDEVEDEEAKNFLGKISNAISKTVEKIVPDEKDTLSDSEALPEDLGKTFLSARKTPQEVAEDKSVPLYVFVISNKPKDVDLGIGYGTDTGLRALARLEHNLLNKDGYQAGVSIGASEINRSIDLHASRPWKHPLNDIVSGNISYEQEEINQGEGNLDLLTKTVTAGINRKIRKENGWNRSYSLRYRLDDLESGITGPDRENLPVPFNRDGARFEQEALLLGYQMDKTSADSITNPSKGWRQYYAIEAGSENALTDTNMAIARAGVSGLYSFGEMDKHQVLASLDTGYIWADDFENVPYKLRFFAGGDRSIRGYDYNSLSTLDKGYLVGGQVLAIGSTEYNYEFKPGLRGALFADFGNAYDTDFDTETKLGVGFGVRWASPVGMVRLDLAAGVLEDSIPLRLHLFVGSPLQ